MSPSLALKFEPSANGAEDFCENHSDQSISAIVTVNIHASRLRKQVAKDNDRFVKPLGVPIQAQSPRIPICLLVNDTRQLGERRWTVVLIAFWRWRHFGLE